MIDERVAKLERQVHALVLCVEQLLLDRGSTRVEAGQTTPENYLREFAAVHRDLEGGEGHWLSGSVSCSFCGHEWVAVRPASAEHLECPQCHAMVKQAA